MVESKWQKLEDAVTLLTPDNPKVQIACGNLKSLLTLDRTELTGEFMSDNRIDFLSRLSEKINRDSHTRNFSDLRSFAYWCRPKNLDAIKKRYINGNLIRRTGAGIVFHIAPANIPLNFAFSFAFSFISGNANIVRLPSMNEPQIDYFLKILEDTFAEKNFNNYSKCNVFLNYERNLEITEYLSRFSDRRIIWGGDNTVQEIKRIPSKPGCIDIPFKNKIAISVLNSESICNLDEVTLLQLVQRFFNDSMVFDQNACSSPKKVLWIGNAKSSKQARIRFWNCFLELCKINFNLQPKTSMDKFTELCMLAINSDNDDSLFEMNTNFLYRVSNVDSNISEDYNELNSGFFLEFDIDSIDGLTIYLTEDTQTLTYFGISKDELFRFFSSKGSKRVDRVVPIGSALDIDILWDGLDLPYLLSHTNIIR